MYNLGNSASFDNEEWSLGGNQWGAINMNGSFPDSDTLNKKQNTTH
ncbi:hypothetical protein [Candidatus Williamhamiltonella defendens]|nr:hypothetical protein [Candidatus Hamiltonella defensa]